MEHYTEKGFKDSSLPAGRQGFEGSSERKKLVTGILDPLAPGILFIMKIAIKTLGCKVNQSESACIEGELRQNGHKMVDHTETPDVCIINTCTVTAKSDYQSRQIIRKAIRTGAKVFATGCYAQLRPEELSKINGLEAVFGNSKKNRIYQHIDSLSSGNGKAEVTKPAETFVDSPETPLKLGSYHSNRSRAFLKIQDGCSFSCSYCAVPMARGKSRSLKEKDVLQAVEQLCADGYKEIVITGIHIGSYGFELRPESSLLKIVKKISADYPQIRLRLSSIEPQEFNTEFLSMIKHRLICPHVHIPLQSGSDKILKAMNRGYNTEFFAKLVNNIISECPDVSIGTDLIAGFPGETEEDFKETLDFLEDLPLSYMHVFPYSKRPDTRAAGMKGQVKSEIIKKRVNIALELAKKKKNDYLTRYLGKRLNVIVERKEVTGGFYRAISDNYIRLLVRADRALAGRMIDVKAVSLLNGDLISEPL